METSTKVENEDKWKRFKSYYVVWKPEITANPNMSIQEFKSYYVVWKPYFITYSKIFTSRFKSYYVVWKLLRLFLILFRGTV